MVMYRWLAQTSDLVPKYSKFYAACGAVALVEDKILLVKESSVNNSNRVGRKKGALGSAQRLS